MSLLIDIKTMHLKKKEKLSISQQIIFIFKISENQEILVDWKSTCSS